MGAAALEIHGLSYRYCGRNGIGTAYVGTSEAILTAARQFGFPYTIVSRPAGAPAVVGRMTVAELEGVNAKERPELLAYLREKPTRPQAA